MNFLVIVFYLITISCGLYVLLILYFSYGWFSLGTYNRNYRIPSTQVSVIIPARNERKNIVSCLEDIVKQDYPHDLFEIIVVDDASDDNTSKLVERFITEHPETRVRLIKLEDNHKNSSKKRAIAEGVKQAKGTLIVTTDADCRMNEKWLSTIVNYYETYGVSMIVGPVNLDNENTFFKKLQSLEFLSLIAASASSVTLNNPILCNGANLAYEKNSFDSVNGFKGNEKYASGDDVFLLQKIKKTLHERIGFIRHTDAIVYTEPERTLNNFISQRIRWISKSRGYKDPFTIAVAVIVYLFNFLLLAGLGLGFINPLFLKAFAFFFIIKIFVDLPILGGISFFVGRSSLLLYYLPLQAINIFYVSFIGICGNFGKFKWKGRQVK